MYNEDSMALYKYQRTRKTSHPHEFLKNHSGIIIVKDGYQVHHSLESEREDLKIAGCLIHAGSRFANIVKSLGRERSKGTLVFDAFKQIVAIYKV